VHVRKVLSPVLSCLLRYSTYYSRYSEYLHELCKLLRPLLFIFIKLASFRSTAEPRPSNSTGQQRRVRANLSAFRGTLGRNHHEHRWRAKEEENRKYLYREKGPSFFLLSFDDQHSSIPQLLQHHSFNNLSIIPHNSVPRSL
jgi:hypothetical protein